MLHRKGRALCAVICVLAALSACTGTQSSEAAPPLGEGDADSGAPEPTDGLRPVRGLPSRPGLPHSSSPGTFVASGDQVLFAADDSFSGRELWRTDGTAEGTVLLRDICPGRCSSEPEQLMVVGAQVFFVARDGSPGRQLWRTDGTAEGTVRVAGPFESDLNEVSSVMTLLAPLGGVLLFAAAEDMEETSTEDIELWRSDGTRAGTWRVKDLVPGSIGSNPSEAVLFQGALYFASLGLGQGELWRTDGTADGTVQVASFGGPPSEAPSGLTVFRDWLYFAGTGASGRELYRTDGTAAGTQLVQDLAPGDASSYPRWLTPVGGRLYFSAWDSLAGAELWSTDGEPGGAARVADIFPGPDNALPSSLVGLEDGRVLFIAGEPSGGRELWRSDGTAAGTQRVVDLVPGTRGSEPLALRRVGPHTLFTASDETGAYLWSTDGTAAGTRRFSEVQGNVRQATRDERRSPYAMLGTGVFFAGRVPDGTDELWQSDGTAAGTRLVKELAPERPTLRASALSTQVEGDRLVVLAQGLNPPPLWQVLPGAPLQASPALDAWPAALAGQFLSAPLRFGAWTYFSAGSSNTPQQLWRTDGTSGGTTSVAPLFAGHSYVRDGDSLFFIATRKRASLDDTTQSIFRMERSTGQPIQLADVWVQGPTEGPLLAPAGRSLIYPGAANQRYYQAPWSLPLEAGGTPRRLWPDCNGWLDCRGQPTDFTAAAGGVYFLEQSSSAASGSKVWFTDGTPEGTREVVPAGGTVPRLPRSLLAAGEKVVFRCQVAEPAAGWGLCAVGPQGGLRVLWPEAGSSERTRDARPLAVLGTRVLFWAETREHGRELWVAESAEGPVRALPEVAEGPASAVDADVRLVLSADGLRAFLPLADERHGRELWETDGTAAGTRRRTDLVPGPGSFLPGTALYRVGERLYFAGDEPSGGTRLWSLDLSH